MSSLKYGTVFKYLDREYIFLAETEEFIYAARILSLKDTKRVETTYSKAVAKNIPNVDKMPIYSFVILQTKELEQRAAHLQGTGNNNFIDLLISPLNIILCKEDLVGIKDEITKEGCVSIRLKELMKDIEI